MILRRARSVLDRAASEVRRSFTDRYTARETAGSFSVGVFITMLPTLGTGLLAFVVLAWASDRVNRIAMAASVIVFNPAVKWGVYASSFALGTTLLGPVPGVSPTSVSLAAGPQILTRLLVGNLVLAVVAAAVSYAVCLQLVAAYATGESGIVGEIASVVATGSDDGEEAGRSTGAPVADGTGETSGDGAPIEGDSGAPDGETERSEPR